MEFLNHKQWKKKHFLQAANILSTELPLGWPSLKEAKQDVKSLCKNKDAHWIGCFVANELIGFVGYLKSYPTAFELHPLVVRNDFQNKGIGQQLVKRIEAAAVAKGALTMYLGTDDEGDTPRTSLAHVDLFEDTYTHMKDFNGYNHPATFYQKQGYKVVGVIPDANGLSRPDIYMAKKLYNR